MVLIEQVNPRSKDRQRLATVRDAMQISLMIPAFISGMVTFLAPCTLPLVPGYLGFISGVSVSDLNNPSTSRASRQKIFLNGVLYVIGFSTVFILLGSLFGLGGASLIKYRLWLSRIGGLFVISFGLFMVGIVRVPLLNVEKRFGRVNALKPGNPFSSLMFGATFALGWTPCIGPILGSILTLAASSATVGQGAFLLAMFSLGLAVPFLLIAASVSSASAYLASVGDYLHWVSIIGGLFLVVLGILLLTNTLGVWTSFSYRAFRVINYDRLLQYL